MAITANSGPQINFGIAVSSSGAPNEYNEQRGPSANDLGEMTLDPRPPFSYKPGSGVSVPLYGWPGCFGGPAVDFIPIAVNTSGIAATFTSTGSSTTTPSQVTVLTSANSSSFRLITNFVPSTYAGPVSVLMLDGYQGGVAVGQGSSAATLGVGTGFGTAATVNVWNPLVMGGRCLSVNNISTSSSDTASTYKFSGFDIYGYAMTAIVAGASQVNSLGTPAQAFTPKAFKYILSSGISFTSTATTGISSQVAIGVSDIYGFPLYVDHLAYGQVSIGPSSGATVATTAGQHTFGFGSSLGFALGLGSSLVSTSSTPDVRGTYTSSLATTGNTGASGNSTAVRVTMFVSPKVNNLVTITSTNFWALVGVPQA